MKTLTVPLGVAQRSVDQDMLEIWANRELVPLLSQIRGALNYKSTQKVIATTDGAGTWKTLWLSEAMPYDGVWVMEAMAIGIGATERAAYSLNAVCESTAGTVSDLGYTVVSRNETDELCSVRSYVDTSGRTIALQVKDNASEAMRFVAVVSLVEAL